MANGKPPAFQLYVSDFLSDENVISMSNAELGGYLRLLLQAWKNDPIGCLPNNDRRLIKMGKIPYGHHREQLAAIKRAFRVSADGQWLIQKRMVMERENQLNFSKKQRERANTRWSSVRNPVNGHLIPSKDPDQGSILGIKIDPKELLKEAKSFTPDHAVAYATAMREIMPDGCGKPCSAIFPDPDPREVTRSEPSALMRGDAPLGLRNQISDPPDPVMDSAKARRSEVEAFTLALANLKTVGGRYDE